MPTPVTLKRLGSSATKRVRKVADTKAARFRSRGPHKCVVNAGVSCKGVHPFLKKHLFPSFDFAKCKANGTLRTSDPPAADLLLPMVDTKNARVAAYSKQQGTKMDTQVTSVVKLHTMPTLRVPLRAFYDTTHLAHYMHRHFGPSPTPVQTKQIRRVRNLRNALLPETEHLMRLLDTMKLTPVSTQDVVALRTLGTRADLICLDKESKYRVIELKVGCNVNFSHGKLMAAPYHTVPFSTHCEHLLQTALTHHLFRCTHPTRDVGPPLLIRLDRLGGHVYHQPGWVSAGMPTLLHRI